MKGLSKVLLVLTVFLGLFSAANCGSSQHETPRYVSNQQNLAHVQNSVVALVIVDPLSRRMIGCSGFFVSPTQIATAEHCVEHHELSITVSADGEPSIDMSSTPPTAGADFEYVTFADWTTWSRLPSGVTRPDLPTHHARVVRWDEDNDVAVLSTTDASTNWLSMAPALPTVGERVYTVSQPGHMRWMLSEGIISQVETIEDRTFVMATAPIYMGSSGCPLVNNLGQVVGVADAIAYRQPSFGLFVPISKVRALVTTGTPRH